MSLRNAELVDVDYGYCDTCDRYEIVNKYKMPVICCNYCEAKRMAEFKFICGKCLGLLLTNGK